MGTETNGSIICPAQVNGVVGLKPTHGLLAIDHIVPIAATQDTAGPITKSVEGAALLLDGMTEWQYRFFDGLDATAIAGMRIGVMNFSLNNNPRLNAAFKDAQRLWKLLVQSWSRLMSSSVIEGLLGKLLRCDGCRIQGLYHRIPRRFAS